MLKILIGLAVVLIDVGFDLSQVNLGSGVAEVLPDFIGYLLILWGSGDIMNQNWRFSKYRWYTFALFIFSLIVATIRLFMDHNGLTMGIVDFIGTLALHGQMIIILKAFDDIDQSLALRAALRSAMAMLGVALLCEIGVFVCNYINPSWMLYAVYLTMVQVVAYGYMFIKLFLFYRSWHNATK